MVGCLEALTGAEKGLEKGLVWRETTTMALTTRPASTATVIRRSDAGSVPGPDVPTAGRERMSIGRLTEPGRARAGSDARARRGGTRRSPRVTATGSPRRHRC